MQGVGEHYSSSSSKELRNYRRSMKAYLNIIVLSFLVVGSIILPVATALPAQFFAQLVDHLPPEHDEQETPNARDNDGSSYPPPRTYPQRYYTYDKAFQGPGSPIFLILGGEGAIEPSRGIMYDIVAKQWAVTLGAYVLQPEHRFYGSSQPVSREEIQQARDAGLPDPRMRLLTTEQALYDAVRLTQHVQTSLGCALDRSSAQYCPVIAVGGSYPGFMAATIRLRFPHVVDLAYSASAPMKFYAQQTPQAAYFEHITHVAELAHSGCASAVQSVLTRAAAQLPTAGEWGLCFATVPPYAADHAPVLAQEVLMMVAILFANSNMGYYPPSNTTQLWNVCHVFVQGQHQDDAVAVVRDVLLQFLAPNDGSACLDMRTQLPTGPHATVSAGDWSGVGTGPGGESWDWQTCTLLIEAIGFDAARSMFPDRPWSLTWLKQHCQRRFGVTPRPHALVQDWRFDAAGLVAQNATYILFTNGLHDGWSVSGIQHNLTETLVAVNFPTGAHHSDLSAPVVAAENTQDINEGRWAIERLLQEWLKQIRITHQESVSADFEIVARSNLRRDG